MRSPTSPAWLVLLCGLLQPRRSKAGFAKSGNTLIVHEDNRALTVLYFPFREVSLIGVPTKCSD
jgi:hypothetical protein